MPFIPCSKECCMRTDTNKDAACPVASTVWITSLVPAREDHTVCSHVHPALSTSSTCRETPWSLQSEPCQRTPLCHLLCAWWRQSPGSKHRRTLCLFWRNYYNPSLSCFQENVVFQRKSVRQQEDACKQMWVRDATAHITMTHGNMESRMRNSTNMQSTREQNFFFWGKQQRSSAWQERETNETHGVHTHKWSQMVTRRYC